MDFESLVRLLSASGSGALALIAYRGMPFLAYAALGSGLSWSARAAFLLGLPLAATAATAGGIDTRLLFGEAPLAFGYFVAVAVALFAWRRARGAALGWLGLAALLPMVFVVAPAGVVAPAYAGPIAVVGAEVALSAYSALRAPADSSCRDYLFFLFVDPVLRVSDRGQGLGQSKPGRGLWRIGLALLYLVLYDVALGLTGAFPGHAGLALGGLAAALCLFLAHAGLAHAQIGLMAVAGYDVPERYRRPYAAEGVADFWHRWNTYLGRWLEAYVYWPVARRACRGTLARGTAHAFGVMVAFGVVGLQHDLVLAAVQGTNKPGLATLFFLAMGALLLGEGGVAGRPGGARGRFCAASRRVGTLTLALGSAGLWVTVTTP